MEELNEQKPKVWYSLAIPGLLVLLMWSVKLWEVNYGVYLGHWGIYPRNLAGLPGILTAPFIHGDFYHLINNTVPVLALGAAIFHFYKYAAWRIFAWSWLMTGLWVWCIARPSWHIGASGLIYAFASFIFFSGVFRRNTKLLALSMLVVFVYGGMVWGVFPIKQHISWESHLLGSIAGFVLAVYYRKTGPQRPKYDWELEDEEEDDDEGGVPIGLEEQDGKIVIIYKPDDTKE